MSSECGPSRYHRQMLLPGVGEAGQARLLAARVLVVGVGALGCGVADLLVRAGVGSVWLLDRDLVEWTNLQRQTLFEEADAKAGLPKAEAAAARLGRVNSSVEVVPLVRDLTSENALATVAEVRPDVLIDGTDNFETRYLLNDLSVKLGVPYAYGGVVGTHGMAAMFVPPDGACLRCVFEEPAAPGSTPTCDTAGVLGPAVSMVSAMQAAGVMRWLVERGAAGKSELKEVDAWSGKTRSVDLSGSKRAECPCCGLKKFEFLEARRGDSAALCGQNAVQVSPGRGGVVELAALGERLKAHGKVSGGRFFVRCVLEDGMELTVFGDARAIVRGTTRAEVARSVYARLVGG